MKAVVHDEYGPVSVLAFKDTAKPTIGDTEVLVRVRAAAVNPPDWAGVHGVPYIVRAAFGLRRPKLGVRGTDLAGTVEAVGGGVAGLQPGDEVFGVGVGTFAEYAVASGDHLVRKPTNVTFEQAAASGMSALTALQALRDAGGIQAGQRVLIVGAGGGIGTFAVQIAKSFGAQVTGVCSTSKQDLVLSIGADRVIDYAQEDFTESGERYDLVLDNVLQHSLSRLLRVVKRDGTLVPNGGQFYKRWFASTGVMLVKAPLLSLVVPQRIRVCNERPQQQDLLVLKELMESGALTPIVGRTYPLNQTAEAIAYFGEGHARGQDRDHGVTEPRAEATVRPLEARRADPTGSGYVPSVGSAPRMMRRLIDEAEVAPRVFLRARERRSSESVRIPHPGGTSGSGAARSVVAVESMGQEARPDGRQGKEHLVDHRHHHPRRPGEGLTVCLGKALASAHARDARAGSGPS